SIAKRQGPAAHAGRAMLAEPPSCTAVTIRGSGSATNLDRFGCQLVKTLLQRVIYLLQVVPRVFHFQADHLLDSHHVRLGDRSAGGCALAPQRTGGSAGEGGYIAAQR